MAIDHGETCTWAPNSGNNDSLTLSTKSMPLTTADRYIAQLRRANTKIRSISLAGNDITNENVDAFATAMLGNTSVTYLAMFCVQGGDTFKGATLLAASAMSLSSLQTLSWSNIFDGGYAVRILAQGIRLSKTLNRVLLMDSKFKNCDIELLAKALGDNTSIETIGLDCCGITDEGAFAISKLIKKNHVLRTLSLNENGITDVGAEALLKSIFDTKDLNSIWASNHSLTSFSRDGNDCGMEQFYFVSPEMKDKISKILDINRYGTNPADIGRHKIALHMEQSFEISWIKELDHKVMPQILSWCGRTASYEILRNIPELFAQRQEHTPLLKQQEVHHHLAQAIAMRSSGQNKLTHANICKKLMCSVHRQSRVHRQSSASSKQNRHPVALDEIDRSLGSTRAARDGGHISRMIKRGRNAFRTRKVHCKCRLSLPC